MYMASGPSKVSTHPVPQKDPHKGHFYSNDSVDKYNKNGCHILPKVAEVRETRCDVKSSLGGVNL